MAELLGQIPNLPGARCKGMADLFEATVGDHAKRTSRPELAAARAAALRTCAGCPALHGCRDWLTGLKVAHRPRGVIAGQVVLADGQINRCETPAGRHSKRATARADS